MSRFQRIVKQIIGEDPHQSHLIYLLEKRGFLVSAITGVYDYEVRLEIINILANIGNEESLDILKQHEKLYRSMDPNEQQVARASKSAINAIERRIKKRNEEIAKKRKLQEEKDLKILQKKIDIINVGTSDQILETSESLNSVSILVADDEEDHLNKIIGYIKTNVDAKVFSAKSFEEAVNIMQTKHISLLITDIVMPMYELTDAAYTTWEKYPTTKHSLLKLGITEENIEVTAYRKVQRITENFKNFAGFKLLDKAKELMPWLPVIIISKYSDIEMARKVLGTQVQDILSKEKHLDSEETVVNSLKRVLSSNLNNLIRIGPERLREYLAKCDEKTFTLHVVAPLLKGLGYSGIRYVHGVNENGIDLICFEIDKFRKKRYIGIQIKAVKIDKQVGKRTNKSIFTIIDQIQQALESKFNLLPNIENISLEKIYVFSSKGITENARNYIKNSLVGKAYSQHVEFYDSEAVIEIIEEINIAR